MAPRHAAGNRWHSLERRFMGIEMRELFTKGCVALREIGAG